MTKITDILKPKSVEELKRDHWKYILKFEYNNLAVDFHTKFSKNGQEVKIMRKIRTSKGVLELAKLLGKKINLEVDELRVQGYYFNIERSIWEATDWKTNGINITHPNLLLNLDPFTEEEINNLNYGLLETG